MRHINFVLGHKNSGWWKRGVEFKGGSRHDRNRHNHRNRQNRQNRHGRLLVLYFVGQAKRGQGALQNRQTRQNRQNRHEGYPLKLNPPFPSSWKMGVFVRAGPKMIML